MSTFTLSAHVAGALPHYSASATSMYWAALQCRTRQRRCGARYWRLRRSPRRSMLTRPDFRMTGCLRIGACLSSLLDADCVVLQQRSKLISEIRRQCPIPPVLLCRWKPKTAPSRLKFRTIGGRVRDLHKHGIAHHPSSLGSQSKFMVIVCC